MLIILSRKFMDMKTYTETHATEIHTRKGLHICRVITVVIPRVTDLLLPEC
jgi:hypothetical protein